MAMSQLDTPIICVVIGEGGSGGALGIGIGDRLAMLEHAYYSVISPEGCATILWKSSEHAPKAAEALKMTSRDLLRFGIIDEIIPEPLGGAHRDHREAAVDLKSFLIRVAPRARRPAPRRTAPAPLREVPPHGRLRRRGTAPQRADSAYVNDTTSSWCLAATGLDRSSRPLLKPAHLLIVPPLG